MRPRGPEPRELTGDTPTSAGQVARLARPRESEGSATVLVLACLLASCLLCGLWLQAGRAALARQRAETAADLAALAAADSLNVSSDTGRSVQAPCAAASSVAASNGAHLELCLVDNFSGVEVAVRVSEPMAAYSRAHAGPVAAS